MVSRRVGRLFKFTALLVVVGLVIGISSTSHETRKQTIQEYSEYFQNTFGSDSVSSYFYGSGSAKDSDDEFKEERQKLADAEKNKGHETEDAEKAIEEKIKHKWDDNEAEGSLEQKIESMASKLGSDSSPATSNAAKATGSNYMSESSDLLANESTKLKEFYGEVFKFLKEFGPEGESEKVYGNDCKLTGSVGYNEGDQKKWGILTEKELKKCLDVPPASVKMLNEAHASYVNAISSLDLPEGSYKGDGVVMVGGSKYSLLALLSIKVMRKFGTTLPVEVFIPPGDEGDEEFCDTILPSLDAKCIYVTDFLPKSVSDKFEFHGYQFKSIAIAASSFRNILLLDSDNFAIKNLDDVFDSAVFTEKGLILWPDFWRRSTSPYYYEIADRDIDLTRRVRNNIDNLTPPKVYTKLDDDMSEVPLHDLQGTIPDVSTESGQLLINKDTHINTVLLSLYYNVHGPTWYYPIFSQRVAGEGDKETFLAAANFLELPHYQVKRKVSADGYNRPGGYRGVAMYQYDFIQDHRTYLRAMDATRAKYDDSSIESDQFYDPEYSTFDFYNKFFDDKEQKPIEVMFVHSNLPKFEPIQLWKEQDLIENGEHVRSYTAYGRLNNFDIELENFKNLKDILCVKKSKFKYMQDALGNDDQKLDDVCKYISDRYNFLESTHSDHFKSSEL